MEASSTKVNDLPDEVLNAIFSYLATIDMFATVMDVCSRWRSIIEDDTVLWKNLQLVVNCDKFFCLSYLHPSDVLKRDKEIYIGEHDLRKVSKMCCIKFEGGSKSKVRPLKLLKMILWKISKICRNIEKVEFSQCFGATSKQFINTLYNTYENINELKFGINATCIIPYSQFSKFSNLNTLISHDYRLTKTEFHSIVEGCQQLKSLWLLFARGITNCDIITFIDNKKEKLRELGLGLRVADCVLQKLAHCHNLNVFFICDARDISVKGINYLNNLSNLKYLSLQRAYIDPSDLKYWISSSKIPSHLEVLDLTDYYPKNSCWISQKEKICPITFNNHVNVSVPRPYKRTRPQLHWMYNDAEFI